MIWVVKFESIWERKLSRLASCSVWEFAVPLGQMAFATEGAACRPFTSTEAAVPAKPESSGPPMNDRPAVRAVRRSLRRRFVFWMGSISRMMGWLMSKPERVA